MPPIFFSCFYHSYHACNQFTVCAFEDVVTSKRNRKKPQQGTMKQIKIKNKTIITRIACKIATNDSNLMFLVLGKRRELDLFNDGLNVEFEQIHGNLQSN